MRLSRLLASLVAVLGACAAEDDKSPGTWTPGKGDGAFDLIEAGPAPVGGSVGLALDHRVPAFRVESYGGMKLAVDLKGKDGADGYLIVEGPLAGQLPGTSETIEDLRALGARLGGDQGSADPCRDISCGRCRLGAEHRVQRA